MMPIETRRRLESQARRQAAEEQRGRVLRVEAQAEHAKACRAISWRTRFAACERVLLRLRAELDQLPNDAGLKEEVRTAEAEYARLLAESPQP